MITAHRHKSISVKRWRLVLIFSLAAFVLLGMKLSVFTVWLVGLIVLSIFMDPFSGLLVLVFLHPTTTLFSSLFGEHVVLFVGLITISGWFVQNFLLHERTVVLNNRFLKVVVLLLYWALLSVLIAYNKEVALNKYMKFFRLIVYYFLIINLVDNEKKFEEVLVTFIIGITMAGVIALKDSFYMFSSVSYFRLSLASQNPNAFGVFSGLAVVLILTFFMNKKFKYTNLSSIILFSILLLFNLILALLSKSRGAWIAILAAIVVYGMVSEMSLKKIRTVMLAILALFITLRLFTWLYPAQYSNIVERFNSIYGLSASSMKIRMNIWATSKKIFLEHPIFGVGIGNFPIAYSILRGVIADPQSDFVQVFCELGIIGGILWILALISIITDSFKIHHFKSIALPILTVLIVAGLKGTYIWMPSYWFLLGTIGAGNLIYARRNEA